MRKASVKRETGETRITLTLVLEGSGRSDIKTGIGFFDHMLTHVARHGLFDLDVSAEGDLEVDAHHTVEDVGICLGKAFLQALGDMKGIRRFGHAVIPMDETLAEASIDFSGRPFLRFDGDLPCGKAGEFDSELAEEFFRAFAINSRATLHLVLRAGKNLHHCIEGLFKAFAHALDEAVQIDPRVEGVPSTKGVLER
ncbi:MAG TPA: imidazoleglycerol-phosphate dehydratase HisB [Candidatus Hydrogenedentes bacterium]|nr:imidazoleglycerol-phosphate dehydratase HisB [Candidatus Hydrogenedentota bacterium]HQE83183.1 imidazoleglycerol-phosphate dehydratase HisB [Candidatus Hydrogenedentota bacterium]HQH50796.1 imidazoleglycerol-phosphate dehydratase HisB [Candidatus Hydrogenedentota bacterium]HQM47734.1 imidazoleglycerol-phosphate dehydratase HisB [Candidatus Hydrogenedentota bacterium]